MPKQRDAAWLADASLPGPNGVTFNGIAHPSAMMAATTQQLVMEDDVTVAQFTPGCGAYAGYVNGTYANMTAVRAYAASQHALVFSYTPNGDPAADAIDIEPGDAAPSDFPRFWHAKGGKRVYAYGSASWLSQIIGAAAGAGIARSTFKLIAAHYIGPHICGPGTCGYPQADATQFTSNYDGRSLDATLCSAGFFSVTPPKPPVPEFPLKQGSTGIHVAELQRGLNKWARQISL